MDLGGNYGHMHLYSHHEERAAFRILCLPPRRVMRAGLLPRNLLHSCLAEELVPSRLGGVGGVVSLPNMLWLPLSHPQEAFGL